MAPSLRIIVVIVVVHRGQWRKVQREQKAPLHKPIKFHFLQYYDDDLSMPLSGDDSSSMLNCNYPETFARLPGRTPHELHSVTVY